MSDIVTSRETQNKQKSAKMPRGYRIAMVAVVAAVLGRMLIFHLASKAADAKASELAQKRIADLAVQMQAGQAVDVWDETAIEAIEAQADKAEWFETARNMTGIFGGIAAMLFIIVLQTTATKKTTASDEQQEEPTAITAEEQDSAEE